MKDPNWQYFPTWVHLNYLNRTSRWWGGGVRGKYISNPNYTGVSKTVINNVAEREGFFNFGQICEMPFMNGLLGLKLRYHLASLFGGFFLSVVRF